MARRSAQRGALLLEVMVALTLLAVGLLGVAGTALASHRLLDRGRWDTTMAIAGASRLELLRSAARDSATCRSPQAGSRSLGAASEQWSAGFQGAALRLESVLQRPAHGGIVAETLQTLVACR